VYSADLQHTYTSTAHTQADVTYALPLPPDSSVHAFEAYIDGHVVKGVVQEKSQARATFETAVSMNQKAALLQQENVESACSLLR
jgi:Ca-activated chloride channel family protein